MAVKKDAVMIFILAGVMIFSTFGTALLVILQNNQTTQTNDELAGLLEQQQQQAPDPLPAPEVFVPEGDVTKLETKTLEAGSGNKKVTATDTVVAHYHGTLAADGTVFDSSYERGEPATFPLANVIEGWQEGLLGMKVGETRRLVIPSEKAYGEAGQGAVIGPDADLVFVVELVEVQEAQAAQEAPDQ